MDSCDENLTATIKKLVSLLHHMAFFFYLSHLGKMDPRESTGPGNGLCLAFTGLGIR
jgi:hypothetical protein